MGWEQVRTSLIHADVCTSGPFPRLCSRNMLGLCFLFAGHTASEHGESRGGVKSAWQTSGASGNFCMEIAAI